MADNQAYEIKIIKNKLRDINYHIKYIGKTILDVGGVQRTLKSCCQMIHHL